MHSHSRTRSFFAALAGLALAAGALVGVAAPAQATAENIATYCPLSGLGGSNSCPDHFDFSGKSLDFSNLKVTAGYADFTGASLTGQAAGGTSLYHSDFTGATFSGFVNIGGAFCASQLNGDFTNANFNGYSQTSQVSVGFTKAPGAVFAGSNFQGACFSQGSDVTGSDLLPAAVYALSADGGPAAVSYALSLPTSLSGACFTAYNTSTESGTAFPSGTASAVGTQTATCRFSAANGSGYANGTFPVTVYRKAYLATAIEDTIVVGKPTSIQLPGGGDGFVAVTGSENLPAGLSVSPSGLLTGTPTTVGDATVGLSLSQTLPHALTGGTDQVTATGSFTLHVVATKPAIIGTGIAVTRPGGSSGSVAQPGEVLTLARGTWSPQPLTTTVAWYRGTTKISGAAGDTYTTAAADAGKSITAKVTGARDGGSVTVASNAIPVAAAFTKTVKPTLTGKAVVGQVLTAHFTSASWTPTGAAFVCKWLRGGVVTDLPCSLATPDGKTDLEATHELTADDTTPAHAISIRVTGTKDGFVTTAFDSAPVVTPGPFTATALAISGTPVVGATLAADLAGWTPAPPTKTYQWYRDTTAIKGATKATYAVATADVGHIIGLIAVGGGAGYVADTELVTTATVPLYYATTPKLTISTDGGFPLTAGATLRAHLSGTWGAAPTPGIAYQWLRDGATLADATSESLPLTTELAGHTFAVRVTASGDGYSDRVLTSSTVSVLKAQTGGSVVWNAPDGPSLTVGTKVTVTPTKPASSTATYQWYRGTTRISGATKAAYTVATADQGATLGVTVTFTRKGYQPLLLTNLSTTVKSGWTTIPSEKIAVASTTGSSLELRADTVGSWTPNASPTLGWQWYRKVGTKAPVAIGGAISQYYETQPDDLGATLTVAATATGEDWTSATTKQSAGFKVGAPLGGDPITATLDHTSEDILPVGTKVTATPHTPSKWSVAYQWFDGDTTHPIAKATKVAYAVTQADAGTLVGVRVTYSRSGYQSQFVDLIAGTGKPDFAAVPKVTIGQLAADGSATQVVLTPTATGSWSPTPDTVSYQWFHGETPVGEASDTLAPLTVAPTAGDKYTLQSTAKKAGVTDKVVTAAVVTNPPVPVVSPFDIQGKYTLPKGVGEDEQVRVGSKFTVTKTAAPSGTKVAYQWLADSAPIAKATTSAFTTTAAQAGKQIDVRLTFSKAGKTSRAVVHTFMPLLGVFTTAPTVTVAPAADAQGFPGVVATGSTLTAMESGAFSSAPDSQHYTWTRVAGKTKTVVGDESTYTLTTADAGASIIVTVTASKEQYLDRTITSAPLAVGKALAQTPAAAIVGTADGATGAMVDVSAWSPTGLAFTYQWYRFRDFPALLEPIPGIAGRLAKYRATQSDAGFGLAVAITATKAGYQPAAFVVDAQQPAAISGPTSGSTDTNFDVPVVGGGTVSASQYIAYYDSQVTLTPGSTFAFDVSSIFGPNAFETGLVPLWDPSAPVWSGASADRGYGATRADGTSYSYWRYYDYDVFDYVYLAPAEIVVEGGKVAVTVPSVPPSQYSPTPVDLEIVQFEQPVVLEDGSTAAAAGTGVRALRVGFSIPPPPLP